MKTLFIFLSLLTFVYGADEDIIAGCPNHQQSTADFVSHIYNNYPFLTTVSTNDARFEWIDLYAEFIQSSVYFEYCKVCGHYADLPYPASTMEMNVMITEATEICRYRQQINLDLMYTVPMYPIPDVFPFANVTVSFLNYLNVSSLSNYKTLDDCYKKAFLSSASKSVIWDSLDHQIRWGIDNDLQRLFTVSHLQNDTGNEFLWNISVWKRFLRTVIPSFYVTKTFSRMISPPPVAIQSTKTISYDNDDFNAKNEDVVSNDLPTTTLSINQQIVTEDTRNECQRIFTYQEICTSLQDQSMIHCNYPFIRKCEKRVNSDSFLFFCKCINEKDVYF